VANRFTAGLNSRRLALTIARRNVRRNPLQSLLIVLVISLPVAFGALGLTTYQSTKATPDESIAINLGQTQAVIQAQMSPSKDNYQEPLYRNVVRLQSDGSTLVDGSGTGAFLDPRKEIKGYKWIPEYLTAANVKTATGQGTLDVIEGKPWASELNGKYYGLTGSEPKNKKEILVNRAALTRLGKQIGDDVTLIDSQKQLTIVGTLESAEATREDSVLFGFAGAISGNTNTQDYSYYAFGEKPITWQQVIELNQKGFGILSRAVIANPPSADEVPLYQTNYGNPTLTGFAAIAALLSLLLLVPIVLLPVAVLAGSAFSFGARRQARTLAVISSLGARASMLRFMTIANGIVLGLIGGLLGVVIGAVGATLTIPLFSDGSRRSYPGFHLPVGLLLLAVASGAVIGAIVSVIPAFAAAKVDVLNTLRGVRRNAKVKKRAGFAGLVVAVIGLASALACAAAVTYIRDKINAGEMNPRSSDLVGLLLLGVALGSVVIVIGLLMGSAWLLVFARAVFRRISPVSNYATNDLIYNRKRYTAVIASVLATSFVGASLMGLVFSTLENTRLNYQPQAENNQLVRDRGFDYSDERITKEQLDKKLAASDRARKSDLETAKTIGETTSASVLYRNEEYGQLGYGVESNGRPIVGAEGQKPFVMRDLNYLCPYYEGSPAHAEYQKLNDAQRWSDLRKLDFQPKYQGCQDLIDDADRFLVGTPADLRVILAGRVDAAAEKKLEAGGAVVFHRGLLFSDKVKLEWHPSGSTDLVLGSPRYTDDGTIVTDANGNPLKLGQPSRSLALPAVLVKTPIPRLTMMISPQTADKLGVEYHASMIVANYAGSVSAAQQDELNQAFGNGSFVLEQGFGIDVQAIIWWFTLGIGFFVLASTGIALGLAQIESRADQSTLGSLGAPQRFRASVVGSQALILTLMGAWLGAAVGYFFAGAIVPSMIENTTLAIPQMQTLVMVVGIPLLAATIFWVGVPKSSKYRQRLSID
jgi:putative ABC transport system permease protein